jgi:23S rRNA (adenine2503-C2)-methyltransferase
VVEACQGYIAATGRRVSFEWAMIDGVNDGPADAAELAALARRLRPTAHVNLIPLNPTPGWPTTGSAAARVREFREWLGDRGVAATVRRNRGTDIDAACGQLARRFKGGKETFPPLEPPSLAAAPADRASSSAGAPKHWLAVPAARRGPSYQALQLFP